MLSKLIARTIYPNDFPDPPPADPMPLLRDWFDDARAHGGYDDYNAMSLATATPDSVPSVRIVLCKQIDLEPASLVFYTNYVSRKGRELEANPRAAAVFYWPHAKRQARVEGRVERVSAEESDAYFRTRPLISRVGATISVQSAEIDSPASLVSSAMSLAGAAVLGKEVQRPEHWGGFRVLITSVELWAAGLGRLHQRAKWHRADDAAWRSAFLSP